MDELNDEGFMITSTMPKVTCKVFKENSGSLDMSTVNKNQDRTKNLNAKLHHFRDYVSRGEVDILPIVTLYQASGHLTKAVNQSMIGKHRLAVQDW